MSALPELYSHAINQTSPDGNIAHLDVLLPEFGETASPPPDNVEEKKGIFERLDASREES